MPTKTWVVGEEVLAADFNAMVQQQVVATFANAAARTAAISSPTNGMLTWRDDGKVFEYWTGTAWQPVQSVYNDVGTLGAARIRTGSRIGTTDAGGIMTIGLNPPLGTVLNFMANVGDNLEAQIFKPVASQFVAGSTSVMFVAVRTSNDTPIANATTRINWTIIDRLS